MALGTVAETGDFFAVEGLAQLQRSFSKAEPEFRQEFRRELRQVAEPVAARAESMAVERITRVGPRWSRMRIGVTISAGVYVAPQQRGRLGRQNPRLKRPAFGTYLLEQAMIPALDAHQQQIVHATENLLDRLGRDWARGG